MTHLTGFSQHTIQRFLTDLASKTPAPGGGAAAPVCAAVGAALAQMVVVYSRGKKSLAKHDAEHETVGERLLAATRQFQALAEDDAVAYTRLNEIQQLPDGDPGLDQLDDAKREAIEIPIQVIALCAEMLDLCASLAPISNRFLLSDLAIAGVLLEACARASRWNVLVNAGDDPAPLRVADDLLEKAATLRSRVEDACRPA